LISFTSQIDGDEWQAFVIQLLYMRYGTNLIEVPDQHKGDSGIEAFSLDGCAFQCYAPEGENDVATTARKHKKKITADLNKFIANGKELLKILGSTQIRRWVLIVPKHCSSDVVGHCQSKTTEIRSLATIPTYVHDEFQVLTVDGHNFFAVEIAELTNKGGLLVEAGNLTVANEAVQDFSAQNNEYMNTLEVKLLRLPSLSDDGERTELRDLLLRMYLLGGNALAYYDSKFPAIADRIRSIKQNRSTALEIDSKIQNLTIAGTRERFELELMQSVPALGTQTATTLSYAAIAEWLMVCPLKPKG